jgi:hypothetical protein
LRSRGWRLERTKWWQWGNCLSERTTWGAGPPFLT